jgi:glucose-1-phosphate thymidylyltransferase
MVEKIQTKKGIILAGGKSTRLYPATRAIVKQLLPVYDKPMVYYPLSALMLAGIRDVLVISTPKDMGRFEELLGDGSDLGMRFSYKIQEKPRGIADAFIVGEDFIGNDRVGMVLGDNIFYGYGLSEMLEDAASRDGAVIFGYEVSDPKRYGIIEFDKNHRVISIEEKPENPKSNFAVVGMYFYDNDVVEIAKSLKPSARGEIEITDINKEYIKRGKLEARVIGRGFAWLDTGTFESMAEATMFIRTIEKRQGLKVSCIEEIAFRKGWITKKDLRKLAEKYCNSGYGEYLNRL